MTKPILAAVSDAADAPATKEMLTVLTDEWGDETVTVTNVESALDRLRDGDFGVVVYETGVAADGVDFLRRLRAEHPALPVILYDADVGETTLQTAYDGGLTEYIDPESRHSRRQLLEQARRLSTSNGLEPASLRSRGDVQLEALAETASDAIVVIDVTSTIRFVNPAIETVLGYEPSELIGDSLTRIMSSDLAERHEEGFERYLSTGEKQLDWDYLELPGQHADGHTVPLSVSFTEYWHAEEHLFTGIVRDISDQKERERELERYETMLDTAGDGLYALDTDGRFVAVNRAYTAITGYSREELLGTEAELVTGPEVAERAQSLQNDLEDGSDIVTLETSLTTKDGEPVPIEARITLFPLGGDDYGRVGVVRDVSERIEAEAMRRKKERQFDAIFDDPVTFFALLDVDGTVRRINDRAAAFIERSSADVGGEPFRELPRWDDDDGIHGTIDRKLRQVRAGEYARFEATCRLEDGERRTVDFSARPVYDESDELEAILVEGLDITERRTLEAELRQERDLVKGIVETSLTGIVVFDADGAVTFSNAKAEEILGLGQEKITEMRTEHGYTFIDQQGNELDPSELQLGRVVDEAEPIVDVDVGLKRPDGTQMWLSVNGAPLSTEDGEVTRSVFTFDDITEQKQRADKLASLNQMMQALTKAQTTQEVCDIASATVRDVLGLPNAVLALYQEDSGRLESMSQTPEAEAALDEFLLGSHGEDLAWQAYAKGESQLYQDLPVECDDAPAEPNMSSAAILPLGKYGVLIIASPERDAFTETDVYLTDILSANAQSALDRTAREESLRDQRNSLQEQNEKLERLHRINTVIREITRALTESSTKAEIERAVCSKLVAAAPYRFAWVGHYDELAAELEPVEWAGTGSGYLDEVQFSADGLLGHGPTGDVVETLETHAQNQLRTDPPFEPWREAALRHGFRSTIAIPLRYQDTLYGVLHIYAETAGVFDQMERQVLTELGQTIGYAMNALDRKQALVSNRSVELRFQIRGPAGQLLDCIDDLDRDFEYEHIVQRSDGRLHLFFSTEAAASEDVESSLLASTQVEDFHLITEYEDKRLYECTLGRSSFLSTLVDRGAAVREIDVGDANLDLTLRIPIDVDARTITELFTSTFESVDLVARRERDEPVMTKQQFQSEFRKQLTKRQTEVLQTAYFSGFFEWPREVTGQDLADILDVSQPTVNRHVRNSERKLFELVFEDD